MANVLSVNPQQARSARDPKLRLPNAVPLQNVDVNPRYNRQDQGILVIDRLAVREKILNVLTVVTGEEIFEPEFGSLVPYRVFEPQTRDTEALIEMDTIVALSRFMKSDIEVLHGECRVTPLPEEDGYAVNLPYVHVGSRALDAYKFNLPARR